MKPSTNLCHELWDELGWCNPSVEHGDEVHGDGDGHMLKMIKLNLEKKKEKNKNRDDQDKDIW